MSDQSEAKYTHARQWLINGGNGHEYGEAGIRSMTVSGEGLIEFLDEYGEFVRAEAQQEMRDRGFQHPDDVAAMILSTDKRAREQSSARLAAAEKLAQALDACMGTVEMEWGEESGTYQAGRAALAEWEAAGK